VRKRPGMYIGSTDSRGVGHLINEIVDNATDEGVAGHVTRVEVTLHPDGSAHRFLKGDSRLTLAWIGPRPAGSTSTGEPLGLPAEDNRRDGSGTATSGPGVVGHLIERD
jgi:hypothetical protein